MLVYHTTSSAEALQILKTGFQDKTCSYGMTGEYTGVWLAGNPLDINDGFEGDTVLALRMPEEVFAKHEWKIEGRDDFGGYRFSIIPAELVYSFGRPAVYSHKYAMSRRDLVRAANRSEATRAAEMREAIRFFDEIGWQKINTIREKP